MHAFLRYPETFHRFVVGSPALGWDDDATIKYERELEEGRPSHPMKLFMSIASDDIPNTAGVEQMAETLKRRDYADLDVIFTRFEGQIHDTINAITITQGLRAVFKHD